MDHADDVTARDGELLSAFDPSTAAAVVSVLQRRGHDAWLAAGDDADERAVMVRRGARQRALADLAENMEQVRDAMAAPPPDEPRRGRGRSGSWQRSELIDDDELREGPPLVMERFADLRVVLAFVLIPLMVVTLAPAIPRSLRAPMAIGVAIVVVAIVIRRRSQR